MKRIFQKTGILLTLVFLCTPLLLLADTDAGGSKVPLDGGSSLLIAAGLSYVAKKVSRKRKRTAKLA
jgi:hypothetical protein